MLSPPEVRRLVAEILATPEAAECLAYQLREYLTLRVELVPFDDPAAADASRSTYYLSTTLAWGGEVIATASVPLPP